MTNAPVVDRIEAFPVEYVLPEGPYGASKVRDAARAGTLVKVTSSEGICGWGESFGPPRVVAAFLNETAQQIVGTRLELREGVWLQRLAAGYHLTAGGLHVAAMSGIDIAMWDAAARTYGVPVSALLGGRLRDEVAAYASTGYYYAGGGSDLGRLRDEIDSAVGEGFNAAKIKIGSGVHDDVSRTGLARDVLGPDGLVMVDYNANETVDTVLSSLAQVRQFEPYWVEEPLPPDEVVGWQMVRQAGFPLAAGEALYTRFGFRDYISEKRIDIVQPNLSVCGGFTEAKVVSQMATAWNLRVSPHCWGTGVLQAATLQLLSTLPASPFGENNDYPVILEFDRGENPFREAVLEEPIRAENGFVHVPDGPGIGVTVDEGFVRRSVLAEYAVDVKR